MMALSLLEELITLIMCWQFWKIINTYICINQKENSDLFKNSVDKNNHVEKLITKAKPECLSKKKFKESHQPLFQVEVWSNQDYESLTADDLICPICFEMISQPIRLPCNHLLCQVCFEKLLELTTRQERKCPKCRQWIGGSRRISDLLDINLQEFIHNKSEAVKDHIKQIASDRRLAFNLIREERRQRYGLRNSTNVQSPRLL